MNFTRQTTGEEGLALLARLKAARPEVPVILLTAWGSISLAVQGMKAGAADFVTKPWSNQQLVQSRRDGARPGPRRAARTRTSGRSHARSSTRATTSAR